MRKKAKISVEVDRSMYETIKAVADTKNITVSDWVRGLVTASLTRGAASDLEEATLNAAYASLDADERIEHGMVTEADVAQKRRVYPQRDASEGHPCLWLERTYAPNYGASDSEGTCRSPVQNGRVCFWKAGFAQNCGAAELRSQRKKRPTF